MRDFRGVPGKSPAQVRDQKFSVHVLARPRFFQHGVQRGGPAPRTVPECPPSYLRGLSNLDLRERTPIRRRPDEAVSHVLRYVSSVRNPENEGWEDAATVGAEVAGETVRLWGAGTLPGYRGRGAYRALVMERCRHAYSLGATLALAKANAAASSPILRAAGFRRVATEPRYALKIAARAIPRG